MSSFFDSEIIQDELKEINEIQEFLYSTVFTFGSLSSEEKIDHIDKILRSQESNDLIQIWNHDLIVQKENDLTKYTDRIDIEAGFLTSFVCIFAKCFYRHRQRRWNLLIDKST